MARTSTLTTGNNVYTFSETTGEMFIDDIGQGDPHGNIVLRTIWDGDGTDTYSFTNFSGAQTIDLRPGAFSTFNAAQLVNHTPVSGGTNLAPGNIANALLYRGSDGNRSAPATCAR